MSVTGDARQLFTNRHTTYVRFIRAVRYPQGLRSFFLASLLLRPGLRVLDAGCGTGALTLAVYEASVRRGAPFAALNGFDLTPAMLGQLRANLERRPQPSTREGNRCARDVSRAQSWRAAVAGRHCVGTRGLR